MAKSAADQRIIQFAEDLGRVFGTVEARAKSWLGERQQILNQLGTLRAKTNELIDQLTGGEPRSAGGSGRRRGRAGKRAKSATSGNTVQTTAKRGRPKGTKMSAEARAKIAAAQRRRWAKARKEQASKQPSK